MPATATGTTTSRVNELTQVGDRELVEQIYKQVQALNGDPAADEFYFLLTEAFERFAPEVELELLRAQILEADGPEALEDYIVGRGRRHAARLTAQATR